MNRIAKLFLFIIILAVPLLACQITTGSVNVNPQSLRGSGNVVTTQRGLSSFSKVNLTSTGELTITIGDQESLTIEAEDNLLPYIESEVRGNTLYLGFRQGTNVYPTREINYVLTAKELNGIEVTSNGNVLAPDLQADSFSAVIHSSGNITIDNLIANDLNAQLTSNGNLTIKGGEVQNQDIRITSSGNYAAKDMQSVEANVNITSSGDVTLRVSEKLTVRITSSGSVYYYGNPSVDANITSSGKVKKVGD